MDIQPTPLKIRRLLKFALYTFRTSFIIGSILLIIFLSDPHKYDIMLYVGLAYVEFAIIFNIVLFTILLFRALRSKLYRKSILLKAALLLCNVPITLFYIYIIYFIITHEHQF